MSKEEKETELKRQIDKLELSVAHRDLKDDTEYLTYGSKIQKLMLEHDKKVAELKGFQEGTRSAKQEIVDEINKMINSFKVLNGKASKCCINAYIEAEESFKKDLQELKSKIEEEKSIEECDSSNSRLTTSESSSGGKKR